jgi:pantoate--beta-alanine ligase
MVQDLNVPVAIVPVATVRESDGLAISSRNQHLSPSERKQAAVLPQALFAARDAIQAGERSASAIKASAAKFFDGVKLEYFSLVSPDTLAPVERIEGPVLIAAAIWLGQTRLIDNVAVVP